MYHWALFSHPGSCTAFSSGNEDLEAIPQSPTCKWGIRQKSFSAVPSGAGGAVPTTWAPRLLVCDCDSRAASSCPVWVHQLDLSKPSLFPAHSCAGCHCRIISLFGSVLGTRRCRASGAAAQAQVWGSPAGDSHWAQWGGQDSGRRANKVKN